MPTFDIDSSPLMITEESKKFSSSDSSSEDETQKKLLDFIKRRQTDLNNVEIPVSDSSTEEEDPTVEYQAHQIDLQDIETLRQRTLRGILFPDTPNNKPQTWPSTIKSAATTPRQ